MPKAADLPMPRGIVMGASSGGLEALAAVLSRLPATIPFPVIVVQHRHPSDGSSMCPFFERQCRLRVSEPCDKDALVPGGLYVAPANYHLLVDRDDTVCLSVEAQVHWSRPSIDVLFQSAAAAWGAAVVGVLLTGANPDGAEGLRAMRAAGGVTLVQDPATATSSAMPEAAIAAGAAQLARRRGERGGVG
jgi:two-component system chemotaxis response regulator CheB